MHEYIVMVDYGQGWEEDSTFYRREDANNRVSILLADMNVQDAKVI
jgi:hypothetical protein